ncbi:MAG TPA: ABC transporter permease [Candidatus Dormibacteraeota bacterium]|nr:ABC transporter permease [Candidatus Dormibacteraeota bacterium]
MALSSRRRSEVPAQPTNSAPSWRRLVALVVKEFIQISRDRRTLALIFFVPLTLMVIFGYAATFDVKEIPAELVGADSAPLRSVLQAGDAFKVASPVAASVAAAKDDLKHGRVVVAIVVGAQGQPTTVLLDGSKLLEAMTAERHLAVLEPQSAGAAVSVDVLYNPSLQSVDFMVPGLVGQIMVQVAMVLTAVGIVRERERGTIEQLMITPLTRLELMVGKTLPYLLISLVDMAAVIVLGRVLFGVPLLGNLGLLMFESLLFLTATLGLGLLISTVAQTQQQAMQMAVFIQLPQMLLSGLVFPLASMPWGVRWMSYLFPLTYFVPITRGIFLKGIGLSDLWFETGVLALMAVLFVGLAAMRFRKTLD